MELTGEIYVFYSNKRIEETIEEIMNFSKKIHYTYQDDSFDNEKSFLFYKNDDMRLTHLEKGYNLDINNEGCFYFEAKETKLKGIAELFEFEREPLPNKIDINLCFSKVYYYVLTVPKIIEEDYFSNKIFQSIYTILGNGG